MTLVFAVMVALGLAACSLTRGDRPPAPETELRALEPSDGRWLVDPQGREYFAFEMPRKEGQYRWANDEHTRVRLRYGIEFDVVSYDDARFFVKIYRTGDAAPVVRHAPTEAELERVAESYRVEATVGDSLRLRPFGDGLPRRGQWRNGFDVADMNGDAHADIVFGPARKGRPAPVVFLGDGAGRWMPWRAASFPRIPFDYGDAAAADLNGDHVPDLVVASHLRGIVAMLGDGRGHFTPWSRGIHFAPPESPEAVSAFTSREIALVDWNRDARPDIVALGEGPRLARQAGIYAGGDPQSGSRGAVVYLNLGDGSWQKLAGKSRNFGSTLACADFNRDGTMDFMTASERRGSITLLDLGQPDGSWVETAIPELRAKAIFRAVASADFDRDGHPDVAVSFLTSDLGIDRSGVDVLLARNGSWQRRTLGVEENGPAIGRLATGDLDGDRSPDLVGVDDAGRLWIFRGDGEGSFARERAAEVQEDERCGGYGLHIADLDDDGRDDIVASFAGEEGGADLDESDATCPSGGRIAAWKSHED